MRPVHDRMLLILTREQGRNWLTDADSAEDILAITPPELERSSAEAQLSLW